MPTPYRTLSWLGPSCATRTHKNSFSRLGLDEQAGPDWNEELQAARDLPQGSLEERLHRDRALLQVNSAFVWAVAQGAETVMDGFVEPVNGNPEDPAFLCSGLFMSQGAGGAVLGGERGRRAAQRLELRGVQAYSDLEGALQGLHTLPTAIVDYRGVRLSAQGLAPGLESSEGLLYGVNAGPQESAHRRQLLQLLAQSAKALALQRHAVMAPNGHQVPLFTSVDAQGLLGADGRFYLLDLFRSCPADANYCPDGWPENYHSESGLPRRFPHGLCRLRPELMQAFIQHKHSQFTQRVRERMEEDGGFAECATAGDARSLNSVRGACKDVGSVSDIIFEMRFNPNIFSPGVSFPSCDNEATKLQERLLREAAALIITHQIPAFVEYCLQGSEVPMDGATLKQALHQRGINMRYLGHVIKVISQSEHRERLRHITRLVIGEIVVRSTRRIFSSFVQGVEVSSLSAAVSHFLCCLLVPHFSSAPVGEETKKKSRRRGRGAGASESMPWSTLTGAELWGLVCQDAAETYDVSDSLGSGPNHLVEHYGLQKLSLLREFCLKTGVQLRLRDYSLDNHSKAPISPDDILNIFPVVKHIHMPVSDASKAYRAAQIFVQKGMLDQAHERLKEAAYLFGRVCDDLHPEACHCHSLLAKVAFLQGQAAEARSVQLKAVVISERVLGFDHPNTIQQYALLAVYAYAGGESALAQKTLLRARLLMLAVHGEDHPFTATVDSCLGLVLTGEQAEQFLRSALRLNTSFFGSKDLRTALNQHLLSQWMCSKGDYRSAMNHEKEALAAFTFMFGEDHPQARCSSEFLRTITQQAVRVERSLRQAAADCTEQTVEVGPSQTDTHRSCPVTLVSYDRLQEFKQRLLEQRAKEEREGATKVAEEPVASATQNGEETSSDKETGCEKEPEEGGSPAEEKADSVQDDQCQQTSVESAAVAQVNGHVEEPDEQNPNEEKIVTEGDSEHSDRPASDAESKVIVNGEVEVKATGEETETHTVNEESRTENGEVKSEGTDTQTKSDSDEVNGFINGVLEITADPSELKSREASADVVVSKAVIANGTGERDAEVNGVAEGGAITNGRAEE
uniref:Clustered mitochondria protein homolog n=1 Tax=Myripristis murdjan TaxID=586833 RepID=A0A667YRG9_9TELE